MDKLRAALIDVSGLAKIAAKMPQSKSGMNSQVAENILVYNTPNFTLSSQSDTLSLGEQSCINSLPSLIVPPNETGTNEVVNAPRIGSILSEKRANQIAEFLNEAVALIRDGMKGMLTNSLGNGAKEEGDSLRREIETNNQSIREIHELHNRIIQERQDLLGKVAETESEVVQKVAEYGALLNKVEILEMELKATNQSLRNMAHNNVVIKVEVEKFKKISQILQNDLTESGNVETNLRREIMELKQKLTEKDIESLDWQSKLLQLQEKVNFPETTGQQIEPTKQIENSKQTYFVSLLKTQEILEKVSQLRDKATHEDFNSHLKVAEISINDLVREHEICKDTMFLIRRDMLQDTSRDILNVTQSGTINK
ncbi:hypothetical protein LOD99_16012 [Oopsacas minuta]|uniref:Uncharacterized protein n=1 Tax=Oopsacas minuta TaxID=111878 RepID=A0AAV7K7H1_9METZ|nr:hypothetical protein LOD99_16012 [Oopsacas minuta]